MLFNYSLRYLIFGFLFLVVGIPRSEASRKPMHVNMYETTVIEQPQVLYTQYPKKTKKMLTKINADIKHAYPIGRPGFLSFQKASLVLTADNIAAIQLLLPRPEGPESLILVGTWGPHNDSVRLHMAGRGLYGLKVIVDGLLQPNNDGYRGTCLLTVTVRGASHLERVVLNLQPVSNLPAKDWFGPAIEGARQKAAMTRSIRKEYAPLSEPRDWIGGVPIPTGFDATIKVKLDGVELAPMKGQLLFGRVRGLDKPVLGLMLTTEGAVVPGWSGWVTFSNAPSPTDSSGQVAKPEAKPPSPPARAAPQPWALHESFREIKEPGVEVTAENERRPCDDNPGPAFSKSFLVHQRSGASRGRRSGPGGERRYGP